MDYTASELARHPSFRICKRHKHFADARDLKRTLQRALALVDVLVLVHIVHVLHRKPV